MDERTEPDNRYRVQSLGRGLDLVDMIAERGKDGARLTDLARQMSLSKAATYAMLQTLLARGFVSDRGESTDRRYYLGLALARLGEVALDNIALADIALPILRELTAKVGLTSRVAVSDDGYAVVVGRIDAPGAVRFDAALGRRELPHSSAVGKILLATLVPDEARAILERLGLPRRTSHTVTKIPPLMRELKDVAERGYAVDDQEDTEGVLCLGAGIFDHNGQIAGAVSITGLKQSMPDSEIAPLSRTLIEYADRVSAALGGFPAAKAWAQVRAATTGKS